jgi:formate dehydrogenase beta subunit
VDLALLEGMEDIETTRWNTLLVDEFTKRTNRPKIFSAGDCETGPDALITACAGGLRAATSIDRLINERPIEYTNDDYFEKLFRKVKVYDSKEDIGIPGGQQRKHLEMLPPDTRKYTFDEVEKGFSTEEAMQEAYRCLRCYRVGTVAV